jgi:CheY-like chemotaxis protein
MKVLVADDDTDVRDVLVEFLGQHGFHVLQAVNGLEALLQVKRQAPDVILLDLRMPRLGGIDALTRIRAFSAAISVIVVTADVDPEMHALALAHGARAVLGKPLDFGALLAALQPGAPAATTAPAAGRAAPSRAAPSTAHTGAGSAALSVLVVDDDEAVREVLCEFLERLGYRAAEAADAAVALRMIVESAPDVVLLDIDMPGLTGTAALPSIRAVAPNATVIMVSGTADPELAKRALTLGAFDFVVKPVDWSYLARSLETASAMRGLAPGA